MLETTKSPGDEPGLSWELRAGLSRHLKLGRPLMSILSVWFYRSRQSEFSLEHVRARIAQLLALDEGRPRPPISLPGQSNGAPPPPPLASRPPPRRWERTRGAPCGHVGSVARSEAKATDNDGDGPYTLEQLLEMDRRFVAAVERAFANGDESREAAELTTPRLR